MPSSLDILEREARTKVRRRAREVAQSSPIRGFFVALGVTPFLIAAFLFVPLLGQILALGSFVLSILYLYMKRSFKLILTSVLGVGSSFLLAAALESTLFGNSPFLIYMLLGFCIAVSVGYIIGISGAIYSHYERGFDSLNGS